MTNSDCPRNLRPWESARGQAFSAALTDWLLQLSVQSYDKPQRTMIWHSAIGRTQKTRSNWHLPAIPYVMETDENAARLLPTFSYEYEKRGDRWVFYNFRFNSKWKCDPETGNIVVPTLSAWSTVMDTQPHYRQARGWPLFRSPCYQFLSSAGICTCDLCPSAGRYRDMGDESGASATVDPHPQVSRSSPTHSVTASTSTSVSSDSDSSPRRVRFLVSSPDASRVRFLLDSSDSSSDATSPPAHAPPYQYSDDVAWMVPRLITSASTPAALSSPEVVRLNVSTSTVRTSTSVVSAITRTSAHTASTITVTTTTTIATTTRVEGVISSMPYPQAEAATSPLNRSVTTTPSQKDSDSTSTSTPTSSTSASPSTSDSSASSLAHAPGNPYSYDSDSENYDWPIDSESDSDSDGEDDGESVNSDAHSTGSWSENHVSLFSRSGDDESDCLGGLEWND